MGLKLKIVVCKSMTFQIIIVICILLLIAYLFDISSAKTKIPSVILLLFLGYLCRMLSSTLHFDFTHLSVILPGLGTIGLILIVLEGSLELDLDRSKFKFVYKTFLMAFIPLLLFSILLALGFMFYTHCTFRTALINAVPLSVISSTIAISSARELSFTNREFVTYESSLSDILGVLMFNFLTLNDTIGVASVGMFTVELLAILVVSIVATAGLSILLSRIKHHVKFLPIIILIILVYAISKEFHLPALLFILIIGIFLGNQQKLSHFPLFDKLKPDILQQEVAKFKELNMEIVFIVRALFFLLFGYLIERDEMMNLETIPWAFGITILIFVVRALVLFSLKKKFNPIGFIAPRGLISILLFLSIPAPEQISLANKSLLIQVVLLSSLFMVFGFVFFKSRENLANS